jgi:CDP-glucose 4,6-dehydratase
MRHIDPAFWEGRHVLVTGHMGFKGAWLCSLLARFGARTWGFGRDDRSPLLYRELEIEHHTHCEGDVNDQKALADCLARAGAEVVFHLAAQSIVLTSYADPIRTFEDNVMGTARVLETARGAQGLKAVVVVTSDKVYRNNEWIWAYRETDPLGGADPYSASKAASEIVAEAMARSFFSGPDTPTIVGARAGNVIGGGDWADFRLLPDAARALSVGEPLVVRNPDSTRPWQHVLDPLSGYVMLAEDAARDTAQAYGSWNFGPAQEDVLPVRDVADIFVSAWGQDASWCPQEEPGAFGKEAGSLAVDSTRARRVLGWAPRWRVGEAVRRTAAWYRDLASGMPASVLVARDLDAFLGTTHTATHQGSGTRQR